MTEENLLKFSFRPHDRRARDFELPRPSLGERIRTFLGQYAILTYPRLIDTSHWNTLAASGLPAIKGAGIVGIIFKATEGTWFTDSLFKALWRPALDLGFIIGVYHFFRSNVSGVDQAHYHLEATRPLWEAAQGHILPSYYDVETTDGVSVTTRQSRLYGGLKEHWANRVIPGVYSSPSLWGTLIGNVPWMVDFWGWDAHWTSAAQPTLPVGWLPAKTRMWQVGVYPKHSWVSYVPGIEGEVDHDYFLGTSQELYQWVGLEPTATLEQRVASLESRVTILEGKIP